MCMECQKPVHILCVEKIAANNASRVFCKNCRKNSYFLLILHNALTSLISTVCLKKGLKDDAKHIPFVTKARASIKALGPYRQLQILIFQEMLRDRQSNCSIPGKEAKCYSNKLKFERIFG